MKNEEAIPEYFIIAERRSKLLIPLQNFKDRCRVKYIKWTHWEYWPMWLVYLPASFYFVYLSIKVKTFCFFSAANPGIENGGMIFESKWNIFNIIPKQYYPKTVIVKEGEDIHSAISKIQEAGMEFPIIAKPDRGERGWCVEIIQSLAALESYLLKCPIDFLLQQYIDYSIELSVFYYRHPATAKGTITSITKKEYLKVTGDGVSDLFSLITADDRAFLQLKKLQLTSTINFNKI